MTKAVTGLGQAALDEFHEHKSAIVDADAHVGNGNKSIKNWYIPKLEMMQSVISNIRANGAVIQYSADVTEHAHITEIKNPAWAGNNQRYEAQICHDLDRTNKLHCFELATAIHNPHLIPFNAGNNTDTCEDNSDDPTALSLAQLVKGQLQTSNDYFEDAALLQNDLCALRPIRTFANTHTAFHLNRHPNFKQMTVEDAATKFGLPDLRPALVDFMHRYAPEISDGYMIGGRRRAAASDSLEFSKIKVWSSVRIQMKPFYDVDGVMPSQLVNACPPCNEWPLGRYDNVIVNTDNSKDWLQSGLDGVWFSLPNGSDLANNSLYSYKRTFGCPAETHHAGCTFKGICSKAYFRRLSDICAAV